MTLLRHGRIVDNNPWQRLSDDSAVTEITDSRFGAPLLVSRQRFLTLHSHAITSVSGVYLSPDEDVGTLQEQLHHVQLIVIEFSEPMDTRGYEQARRLREQMHYGGELRASGPIRADQIPFLARAGFDAFELAEAIGEPQLHELLSRTQSDWQPSYELAVAG